MGCACTCLNTHDNRFVGLGLARYRLSLPSTAQGEASPGKQQHYPHFLLE
jgi:hypothetical protein